MAGISFTHFGEAYVLNWLCKAVQPPKLNLWLALYTSNPGESGTGAEVTGGSYARQQIVNVSGATVFGAITTNTPTGSTCSNTNLIQFPQATANWGTITHMGLWDAQTGGHMIAYAEIPSPDDINNGNQAQIQPAMLSLTVD